MDALQTLFKRANCHLFIVLDSGISIQKISREIGVSRKHAESLLARWVKAGLLTKQSRGKYVYTEIGLELKEVVKELDENLGKRGFNDF
jgi:predicted transcriptional regulator